MNNILPKPKSRRTWHVPVLLVILFALIYSCRKDIATHTPSAVTPSDPKIAAAKTWYETNFKKQPSGQQTTNASSFDLSRFFNPDWDKAKNYVRFYDDVVELPVDSASGIGLVIGSGQPTQSNSRSSVLILKHADNYNAYLMTIVADAEYLAGDKTKLAKNSYAKHEADFSGMVYYTSPRGVFVSGWTYKNGSITGQLTTETAANGAGKTAVQSVKTNLTASYQLCTAWYQLVPDDGDGGGFHWIYLDDTDCHTVVVDVPGPTTPVTTPTSPGGGGSGGGSTSPGNPNPCPPQAVESIKSGVAVNSLKVNLVNPGDGGFPPPGGGGNPCTVPVDDPCAKLKQQKQRFADDFNAQKDAAVLAQQGASEFGSVFNLTDLNGSGTYKNTPITPGPDAETWIPNFKWNSTDGFTIGSVHKHPKGNAPSPNDVLGLVGNLRNSELTTAGETDKAFYQNNVYKTVVTNSATYVITVNDWDKLGIIYDKFRIDPESVENLFEEIASGYEVDYDVSQSTATEYALTKMFGDAINVYKSNSTSTNFAIVGTQDGKLLVVRCPN